MLPGQIDDCHGVGKRTGQGFVDEDRFAGRKYRANLLKMRASIDALQQNDVDFFQQSGDGIDDFHAHGLEFGGIPGDAVAAGGQVAAAAGKSGDDPDSGEVARCFGVVEQLCERDHMRGVKPDDPGAQRLAVGFGASGITRKKQGGQSENDDAWFLERHSWLLVLVLALLKIPLERSGFDKGNCGPKGFQAAVCGTGD